MAIEVLESSGIPAPDNGIDIVPVRLHNGQYKIFRALDDLSVRQIYAKTGRQWGKTAVLAFGIVNFGTKFPYSPHFAKHGVKKPTKIAICGPDYKRGKRSWDELHESYPGAIERNINDELTCWLSGGAQIDVFSGEHIGSIRGGSYDLIAVDEEFAVSKVSIDNDIRPATAARSGRMWHFSTPKLGKRNHFSKSWLDAKAKMDSGDKRVMAFEGPTWENPFVDPAFIEEMREELDDITFREEIGGEILDASNNFLDPSLIKYIPQAKVPGNTFNVLTTDFAFGAPPKDAIDKEMFRRKDRNVLNVLRQDNMGYVYSQTGLCEPEMKMEEAFEACLGYIKEWDCRQMIVEQVGMDWFTESWRMFTRGIANVPRFSIVRPTRMANWKANAFRRWSMLLEKGRFFLVEGNPRAPIHECGTFGFVERVGVTTEFGAGGVSPYRYRF